MIVFPIQDYPSPHSAARGTRACHVHSFPVCKKSKEQWQGWQHFWGLSGGVHMGLDNAATWSKTGLNLGHGYGPLMFLLPSAGRNAFRISALFRTLCSPRWCSQCRF